METAISFLPFQSEVTSQPSKFSSEPLRVCVQCGISDTPLWRRGPSGPKSMCNRCGIRWKRKEDKKAGKKSSSSSKPKAKNGEVKSAAKKQRIVFSTNYVSSSNNESIMMDGSASPSHDSDSWLSAPDQDEEDGLFTLPGMMGSSQTHLLKSKLTQAPTPSYTSSSSSSSSSTTTSSSSSNATVPEVFFSMNDSKDPAITVNLTNLVEQPRALEPSSTTSHFAEPAPTRRRLSRDFINVNAALSQLVRTQQPSMVEASTTVRAKRTRESSRIRNSDFEYSWSSSAVHKRKGSIDSTPVQRSIPSEMRFLVEEVEVQLHSLNQITILNETLQKVQTERDDLKQENQQLKQQLHQQQQQQQQSQPQPVPQILPPPHMYPMLPRSHNQPHFAYPGSVMYHQVSPFLSSIPLVPEIQRVSLIMPQQQQ